MKRRIVAALFTLVLLPLHVAAQSDVLRLSGEVRVRGDALQPAGLDSVDAQTLLRSRLGLEAQLSPRALVFLQVQDARTFGEELGTADGTADRLDLHQAFLQYGRAFGTYAWSLRAGRQEIALGNERLVGAVNWSNTGRAFDGLRFTVGPAEPGWNVTTFAATVRERGRRLTGVEQTTDDQLFLGAYFASNYFDAFALHDRETEYRDTQGIDRTTLGGRITSPSLAGFSASVEGGYQLGNQLANAASPAPLEQDIAAYYIGARAAHVSRNATFPRLTLGFDLLSGDDDPADDTYRAFNTLYATNHKYYGYIDIIQEPATTTRDAGLLDGMVSATIKLPRAVALDVDAHGFWLQEELAQSGERLIGWELDLTVPVTLGTGQQLHLGYSAFRNGPAAQLLGLGDEKKVAHWAYIQATFAFGGRSPIL